MHLNTIDWSIVGLFFLLSLAIGIWVYRHSGNNSKDFFLSGRNMPWWLLGVSMVATTFSADTPNLVTDIVRKNGVAGNWVWWAFLLTGMLTVFVYAKLWRRSGVTTDLGFYEMRYSGKAASFLRGFRALYLGVFFNVVIMATVTLAAIKIGGILLGITPFQTVLIGGIITVIYSGLGGLKAVLITDLFQFILAMVGTIWAAVVILDLPEIGGLSNLLSHPNVQGKLNFLPDFSNTEMLIPLLIIPLAVQWWSVWYPGAEPGGGGYIAQRMLAAKDEKNAVNATLFFNFAHYALRPWPWILIALASLIIFPDLASLKSAFPGVEDNIINDDLAYPAMMTYLPHGLLGLVIASLSAAYMSTISTHLNWGSSYIVHDWYERFIKPEATESEKVRVGRISTVVLMILASGLAITFSSALDAFNILLQIGAGTGLLFILRWFWWRINAMSEIAAMVSSFAIAFYFKYAYNGDMAGHYQLLWGVGITTIIWLLVTFITRPTDLLKLESFVQKIQPGGPGWKPVIHSLSQKGIKVTQQGQLPAEILMMVLGTIAIYSALFGTGFLLYRQWTGFAVALGLLICSLFGLIYLIKRSKQ